MFGFWGWLRAKVKATFLLGIQDGMDELTSMKAEDDQPAVTLRLSFSPPQIEQKKGRKAE